MKQAAYIAAMLVALSTPSAAQQSQETAPVQDTSGQSQARNPDANRQNVTMDMGMPSFVMVIDFKGGADADQDMMTAAASIAQDARIAEVTLAPEAGKISGTIVLEDPNAFADLQDGGFDTLFAPLGGAESVEMQMTAFRPALLRMADPEALMEGMGELTIEYTNTGNDSEGDADIDAVTVICTGPDAKCTPSN